MNKLKTVAGYRLHLERLRFSNSSVMRTIKYPLGIYEDKHIIFNDLSDSLASNIKWDYEALYGAFNLSTYVNSRDIYSLKDFWLDCLKMGMILLPSANKLKDCLNQIKGRSIDDKVKARMRSVNESFLNLIDFSKFKKEILLSTGIRGNKTSFGFCKYKRDDSQYSDFEKMMRDTLDHIRRPDIDEDAYWLEKFGADKNAYKVEEKLVFFLLPDWQIIADSKVEPIDIITQLEQYLINKHIESVKIEDYTGIGDSGGGLSQLFNQILNYFWEGDVEAIKDSMNRMDSSFWEHNNSELNKRLSILQQKSMQLRRPKIVQNYSDYRTDFAGKIQSWLSNTLGQDLKIKQCLFDYEDHKGNQKHGHFYYLDKILEDFKKYTSDYSHIQDNIKQLKNILEKLAIYDNERTRIEAPILSDYIEQLKQFKTNINYFLQQNLLEQSWEKEYDKLTKPLKEPPKIPSFLGHIKSESQGIYDKYLNSLNRMRISFNFLQQITEGEYLQTNSKENHQKRVEGIKRFLQNLLEIYRRQQTNRSSRKSNISSQRKSNISSQIIEQILNKVIKNPKWVHCSENDYIFRARQSRNNKGESIELNCLDDELVERVHQFLEQTKIHWGKYESVRYLHEWVDLIEIEKIRFGLLSQNHRIDHLYTYIDDLRNVFERIDLVFNRFSQSEYKSQKCLITVINQAIFPEIKGTVSKMTTEEIVCRYIVQPIESEQKFPIVTEMSNHGIRRSKNEKYHIEYNYNSSQNNHTNTDINILSKKNIDSKIFKNKKIDRSKLLSINTSNYQIQFLDNCLSGKWKDIKISSYSFIYEEMYKISWSDKRELPIIQRDDDRRKLFVSIPFSLIKQHQKHIDLDKVKKMLGVDLGEYGVAIYVMDEKNFDNLQPYTKFIYEASLRKIRDGIRDNKKRQKSGTFSISNTYVQRIRDHSATAVRNKIHNIVINQQAQPVYEWEVSHFESGSNRISKLYHSIKRSDGGGGTDADKMERKLTWGFTKSIGLNISAYATSYCCSHCKQSIYQYADKKGSFQYSSNKDARIINIIVDQNISVKGYLEYSNSKAIQLDNIQEVIKAVRKYSRPSLDIVLKRCPNIKSQFLRFAEELDGNQNFLHLGIKPQEEKIKIISDMFNYYAGSQSIYICAFCNSVSDADLQAAMWIALKGYMQKYYKISKKDTINHMLQIAKSKSIQPINFDIYKRLSPKLVNDYLRRFP